MRVNCICLHCGRQFLRQASEVAKYPRTYCSRFCKGADSQNGEDEFWRNVTKTDTCWPYTGGWKSNGYGQVRYKGQVWVATRLAWTLLVGHIPAELFLCHNCDILYPKGDLAYRACVRPEHLFLGTQAENIQDMVEKGRWGGGGPPGERAPTHKLTENQVREIFATPQYLGVTVDLARRFGVSSHSISMIRTGKAWRHLNLKAS